MVQSFMAEVTLAEIPNVQFRQLLRNEDTKLLFHSHHRLRLRLRTNHQTFSVSTNTACFTIYLQSDPCKEV